MNGYVVGDHAGHTVTAIVKFKINFHLECYELPSIEDKGWYESVVTKDILKFTFQTYPTVGSDQIQCGYPDNVQSLKMKGFTGDNYVHDVDPAIFSIDTATSEITVNPLSNT